MEISKNSKQWETRNPSKKIKFVENVKKLLLKKLKMAENVENLKFKKIRNVVKCKKLKFGEKKLKKNSKWRRMQKN